MPNLFKLLIELLQSGRGQVIVPAGGISDLVPAYLSGSKKAFSEDTASTNGFIFLIKKVCMNY
jgi:hypothetical protein